VGGPSAPEFLVTANGCREPVGPGLTCSVTIVFAPRTPGVKNAVLLVTAGPVARRSAI
jgi:hypothetical protein